MSAEEFDAAFAPLFVEYKTDDNDMANVTDRGVKLLVQPGYCAHCRDIKDGAPWCRHKEAAWPQDADRDEGEDLYNTYADALEVGVQ